MAQGALHVFNKPKKLHGCSKQRKTQNSTSTPTQRSLLRYKEGLPLLKKKKNGGGDREEEKEKEAKVTRDYKQYSCLENPRDRGAWWAAVYGVAQSRT